MRMNFGTTIKLTRFYKIDIPHFIEITKSLNFESSAGGDERRRSRGGGSLHGTLKDSNYRRVLALCSWARDTCPNMCVSVRGVTTI